MKLALVGVGGAGGRIADGIYALERSSDRTFSDGNVLAFDTDRSGPELDAIPRDQRIVVGDTHPGVGEAGVDGDVDLAAEATREELPDVRRILDFISIEELDGVLLVAGLGGGTGGGTGAVLLETLQEMYETPVYALGVLPDDDEPDSRALNAARSLRSVVPAADNTILFDNDAWRSVGGDDREETYDRMNRELAVRVLSLLAVGERDGAEVAESAVDPSDMMQTLDTGGVSSIGYASIEFDDGSGGILAWLYRLLGNGDSGGMIEASEIQRLVRLAVTSQLTLPCNVTSTERALVVLSGPSSRLSRRGFESARHWVEQETETVEVRAGDEPDHRSPEVTATVLLSNVTDVPRIDALQERAVAHQRQRIEPTDG